MKYIILIDNNNIKVKESMVIRNYLDFRYYIAENGLPDEIHFGDLNNSVKNTFDCAKFLVEYCLEKNLDLPIYFVHSMNYIGKENIISIFENYKKCKEIE